MFFEIVLFYISSLFFLSALSIVYLTIIPLFYQNNKDLLTLCHKREGLNDVNYFNYNVTLKSDTPEFFCPPTILF